MNSMRKSINVSELLHWCVCCGACAWSSVQLSLWVRYHRVTHAVHLHPSGDQTPSTCHWSSEIPRSLWQMFYTLPCSERYDQLLLIEYWTQTEPQPSLKPVLLTASRHALRLTSSPQCKHITQGQVTTLVLCASVRTAQAQWGCWSIERLRGCGPREGQRLEKGHKRTSHSQLLGPGLCWEAFWKRMLSIGSVSALRKRLGVLLV